jgi:uncharacterized SAM-binding protein YcdF (DUF218 family)
MTSSLWFALKALVSFFLLPPVNLVLAIFVGLLLLRARPRLGRWIIGVSAALLLLLSVPLVGNGMLAALETGLPNIPPPDRPPGAIVILAAEERRIAGPTPEAEVGRLTLERLRAGAELYRRTQLPILVSGGRPEAKLPSLAAVMAESLRTDFQVPVRWMETRSRDTWENARDSAAILKAAGIGSVYVVTHPWHERRALIAFRRAGLIATAAPGGLDPAPDGRLSDFVPRVSVWLVSFYALHEWIGCAWYALL